MAAGGVAANKQLRASLEKTFKELEIPFYVPPISLCTDNAAMIAAAGASMFEVEYVEHLTMNGRPGMELSSWNKKYKKRENCLIQTILAFLITVLLICQEEHSYLLTICG